MSIISAFFAAFMYVVFAQNLVFTGGYGISESIRSAARPRQLMLFSITIVFFSTITSFICRILLFIPALKAASITVSLVVYAIVLIEIFLITIAVLRTALKGSSWTEEEKEIFFRQTAVAAFNTLVFVVPFINEKAACTVGESIAQGFGAGIAFILATVFIHFGMKKIEANPEIPESFKGIPALFMYIAILSIAFTGFTGKALFF
ncbi:MAG: hypothetical protein GX241_01420 [Ruminococcaceae bacterium]|nr:hypothetical protein [Oscillospiraceae bacterium]